MSVPPDAVWGSTRTSTGEGTRWRKRRRDTHVTRSKKRCGLRETQHDEGCSCSQDIVSIVTATARIGRSKRRRDDTRSTIRHGLRSDIVVETGNLGFGDEQTTASQVIAASVNTHTAPHIASAWPASGRRPRQNRRVRSTEYRYRSHRVCKHTNECTVGHSVNDIGTLVDGGHSGDLSSAI